MPSYRSYILYFLILMVILVVPFPLQAGDRPRQVNGIYFLTQPADYKAFQDTIDSYKHSGANTVIIKPVTNDRGLDRLLLAKAVFFAHRAGMNIFVLVPTRSLSFVLKQHPDWEDAYYDLYEGTLEGTGKLDLFNPYVAVYLSDLFRDIAGYAVDGILLDDDFSYRDTEGLAGLAMEQFKQKFGSRFSPRAAFARLKPEESGNHPIEEYGEGFWKFVELKKNKLLLVLRNMMMASQAVNQKISFGITIHVPGLFLNEKELLAWYSHDLDAFNNMNIDYFWLAVPSLESRDAGYREGIQTISRIATSSLSVVNDPAKMIFGVQAVSTLGRLLPLSEIEEVSAQTRKARESGIAFMVDYDSQMSPVLMKKIFGRRAE